MKTQTIRLPSVARVLSSDLVRRWRWNLADVLSWMACKLRGHRWTQLPDNYPGICGNRAAALKDRLWQLAVLANYPKPPTDYLDEIETKLDELGRLAGENWGHWKTPNGALSDPEEGKL